MIVSTKGKNAVKLMLDLAQHNDGEPVPLKDTAARYGISLKYLEQTAAAMNKAGLIQSVKGNQGGYLLRYAPERYTMKDILTAAEGSISPTDCVGERAKCCPNSRSCITFRLWTRLDDAISKTLEDITLADLLDWQEEMVIAGEYSI